MSVLSLEARAKKLVGKPLWYWAVDGSAEEAVGMVRNLLALVEAKDQDCESIAEMLHTQEQETIRLMAQVESLQGYVQHLSACQIRYRAIFSESEPPRELPPAECTCGLDAALGAL